MEEDLVQKIHQAEVDLQSAVAESEGYKKSQEELKVWQYRMLCVLLLILTYLGLSYPVPRLSPFLCGESLGMRILFVFCKPVTI